MVGEIRILIMRGKNNWSGHVLRGEGMMKEVMKGKFDGKIECGRTRIGMLDQFKQSKTYDALKRKSDDKELLKNWTFRTCRLAEH